MSDLIVALGLAFAAAVSGILSRFVAIPLPFLQILIGVALALAGERVTIRPDLFFLLFVAPLLFDDARRFSKRALIDATLPVLSLALGLVLLTVLGIGWFAHWMIPAIPLAVAFALAAVLAPTDAIALRAIASSTSIPIRLRHILEGEALINDATGLVCFRFAVAAMLTGHFSFADATFSFCWLFLGGIAVGVGLVWMFRQLQRRIIRWSGEHTPAQVLLLLMLPFATYILAEEMQVSGILAAVAAGAAIDLTARRSLIQVAARMQRSAVWDVLEFALNGVVFILLGLHLPRIVENMPELARDFAGGDIPRLLSYIGLLVAALFVLRFLWIWASLRLTIYRAVQRETFRKVIAAMTLAGARGVLTLAATLSIPLTLIDGTPFPARDLLIFLAAGVILVTLVLGSLALPPLLRQVELPSEDSYAVQERATRLAMAEAGLREVERTQAEASARPPAQRAVYAEAAVEIVADYTEQIATSSQSDETRDRLRLVAVADRELRVVALRAQREELYRLNASTQIDQIGFRKLLHELDLAEAAIVAERKARR